MKKWRVMVHAESISASDLLDEHFKLINKKRVFIFFGREIARNYIRALLHIARHYKRLSQEKEIANLIHDSFLKNLSASAISRLFNVAYKIDHKYELKSIYSQLQKLKPNDDKVFFSYIDLLTKFSDSSVAFDKLANYLAKKSSNITAWQKLILLDKSKAVAVSLKIYNKLKINMSYHAALLVSAMLSEKGADVHLDWNEVYKQANKYTFKQLEHFITAAFVNLDTENFKLITNFFLKKIKKTTRLGLKEPDVLILANYLYKAGDKATLMLLLDGYRTNNYRLAMYHAFAMNNLTKGLVYRSAWLKEAFLKFYSTTADNNNKNKAILYPEKDLCGDVFSSFYFKEAIHWLPAFSMICDERLLRIYQRTYPEIHFIPKSPPKIRNNISNMRFMIPTDLLKFIDLHAYEQSQGAQFFNFDIENYISSIACQQNLESGWLRVDEALVKKWENILHTFDAQYFVGVAASSTHSTPDRDVYTISFDHWQPIFDLERIVFINLNPAMNSKDCRALEEKFNIRFVSLELDLFNDFENLLALMSCLDFAILPANNLMDFAAAIGLKTYIFSPTNIMKNWVLPDTSNYVFSKKIKFIMSDNETFLPASELVTKMVRNIAADFPLHLNQDKPV